MGQISSMKYSLLCTFQERPWGIHEMAWAKAGLDRMSYSFMGKMVSELGRGSGGWGGGSWLVACCTGMGGCLASGGAAVASPAPSWCFVSGGAVAASSPAPSSSARGISGFPVNAIRGYQEEGGFGLRGPFLVGCPDSL